MIDMKGIYRRTQLVFESCTDMLSEGKHWPEDYKKTAFNTIKQSQLGQQSWYANDYIKQDVDTFANEFGPLSHKNSNLGFFATIIKWFVEYSTSKEKYQEFIERKLDGIIRDLQTILNDSKLDQQKRDSLKKLAFSDFEKMQKENAEKLKTANTSFTGKEGNDYDIFFIKSYEELHSKFGGDKTGYHGQSEWCHTNGKSTYESWTSNNTKFFFVLAKKGWKKIAPPKPASTNAYDNYGTSLIAILVDKSGELLNATLRWNHIIEPSKTVSRTSVDRAFLTFKSLSDAVRMDVKKRVFETLKKEKAYSKYTKIVYSEDGLRCAIVDGHFVWLDDNDNEVAVPLKIDGDFYCANCTSLTSLEGAPKEVGRSFVCSDCNSLTSLEGAPREVGGSFNCSACTSLTSLEGAPREVGGSFNCSACTSLTSLEGAPKKVSGYFDCSYCDSLASLDGAPKEVDGCFYCYNCNSLTSLEGAPKEVSGDFYCSYCNSLTSLEGAPKKVSGDFVCYDCNSLTSLEGAPEKVSGNFNCSYCTSLTSLEGAPKKVSGEFSCSDCNSLTSLEGAPKEVGRSFYCSRTKITSSQQNAYLSWLKTQPKENYKEMKVESNMIDLKKMYEDAVMAVGAAPASGGEIAAPSPTADADIVKGGMTTDDVLGKDCDHHKHGYLGPGCFHVPSKACKMFKREILAGKKKKKQKNDYVKGMTVLVDSKTVPTADFDKLKKLSIDAIFEFVRRFSKNVESIISIAWCQNTQQYYIKFKDAEKTKFLKCRFDGKQLLSDKNNEVYDVKAAKSDAADGNLFNKSNILKDLKMHIVVGGDNK